MVKWVANESTWLAQLPSKRRKSSAALEDTVIVSTLAARDSTSALFQPDTRPDQLQRASDRDYVTALLSVQQLYRNTRRFIMATLWWHGARPEIQGQDHQLGPQHQQFWSRLDQLHEEKPEEE